MSDKGIIFLEHQQILFHFYFLHQGKYRTKN